MSQDWADKTAQQLLSRAPIQKGICLILGGADTGKTTLATALAKEAAANGPVGIIDADIGQSHIGPPTTVGWTVINEPQVDFSQLDAVGISFVGGITPVGHLLQLTAVITQGLEQISKAAELIIIDTPGFIHGSAAAALWWTLQRILQPKVVLAVQRNNELNEILLGLRFFDSKLELITAPAQIPTKSPQDRRNYRQRQFNKYFRNSHPYDISLTDVAVQTNRNLSRENLINRLVALRDGKGTDVAIGLIKEWQNDKSITTVRAPQLDIKQVRCLVIGDVSIEITDEQSCP